MEPVTPAPTAMASAALTLVWPASLAYLRCLCAADEVASTLRHEALNEIAGIGALTYRLRRRLEARFDKDPDVLGVLDSLEARMAGSPTRLGIRFLPSPRAGSRADLLVSARAVLADLALPAEITCALGPAESPVVAGDPEELKVAVGCLLENSAEALHLSGRSGPLLVEVRAERDRRVLEVRDDGDALDPAVAERLLDPFFTTRPGRAGLGLKIARRIAQRWNGELLLSRTEPRGLRVELVFPVD
jgi:signal transduction histidine kinase